MNYKHKGRWDIKEVKYLAKLKGYQVVNDKWINSRYKITFKSPSGFIWKCSWDNFYNGCRECPDENRISFFKQVILPRFEEEGCTLLLDAKEYKGQFQELYYKCKYGAVHTTCWNTISSNKGKINLCRCSLKVKQLKEIKYLLGKKLHVRAPWFSLETVDDVFKVRCSAGHMFKISLSKLRDKKRKNKCGICFKKERSRYQINKNNIALYDTFKLKLINECEVSFVYKDGLKLLLVSCKECGKLFIPKRRQVYERLSSIKNKKSGNNYFFCSNSCKQNSKYYNKLKTSKFENSVLNFVKTFYIGSVEHNNRNVIVNPITGKNLELDIFIPELKKAIECNGTYWHSVNKVIKRDLIKKREALKLGIELFVIDELDWYKYNKLQKYKIKCFLGLGDLNETKYYSETKNRNI